MLKQFVMGVAVTLAALFGTTRSAAAEPAELPFDMPELQAPTFPDRTFNVRKFGAVEGGEVSNSRAFRDAIAAAHAAGGGRVLVPNGTWLTGPIHLQSNVNLHLADDAIIRLSTDPGEYLPALHADSGGVRLVDQGTPHERHLVYLSRGGVRLWGFSPQIYGYQVENVAITGKGTIDGQGKPWWGWTRTPGMETLFAMGAAGVPVEERLFGYGSGEHEDRSVVRPPMFQTIESSNVLIDGPTFKDGASWMLHPVMTENLIIRNARIIAPKHSPNTDGIDPDMCRNVLIENVYIDTGDDAIAIKSGRDQDAWAVGRPTENVVIRDVEIGGGRSGIAIGSEVSTEVRNVFVDNVRIKNALRGIRLKSLRGRAGVVENIWIQNVAMKNIGEADKKDRAMINVTLRYGSYKPTTDKPPTFRNIYLKNIQGEGKGQAVQVFGLPESPLQNIVMDNVKLTSPVGLEAIDTELVGTLSGGSGSLTLTSAGNGASLESSTLAPGGTGDGPLGSLEINTVDGVVQLDEASTLSIRIGDAAGQSDQLTVKSSGGRAGGYLDLSEGPTLELAGPSEPAEGDYILASFDNPSNADYGTFSAVSYNGKPLSSTVGSITYRDHAIVFNAAAKPAR